jgi:hypothetical protein
MANGLHHERAVNQLFFSSPIFLLRAALALEMVRFKKC